MCQLVFRVILAPLRVDLLDRALAELRIELQEIVNLRLKQLTDIGINYQHTLRKRHRRHDMYMLR